MTKKTRNKFVKNLYILFFTTIIYWFFGKLGLTFAIPPGYATAIFPAAGIALAATLLCGRYASIGVFIGAVLLYLPVFYNLYGTIWSLKTILPTVVVAVAAYLQAVVSVILIRWLVPNPFSPVRGSEIFKFMIIGVLIGSSLNAIVSLYALYFLGSIHSGYFVYSFATWISGNAIGVMIFTPLILILLNKYYIHEWSTRIIYCTPLLISFTLAGGLYFNVNRSENFRLIQHFQEKADKLSHNLTIFTRDIDYSLSSLQSFFNSSEDVTKNEFKKFTSVLFKEHPLTIVLEWAPQIPSSNRTEFERKNFPITEINLDEQLIPALKRPTYFPILYLEPHDEANNNVVGFDVFSRPETKFSITKSCNTGKTTATSIKKLIQGGKGFLIYRPVYQPGILPKNYSCENVRGFVVGIYSIDKLVTRTIKESNAEKLNIKVYENVHNKTQIIYNYSPLAENLFPKSPNRKFLTADSSFLVPIIDHKWRVEVSVPYTYFLTNKSWSSWLVLFFGMLFTGILSTFTLTIVGQNQVLQEAVQEATTEIKKQRLMAEEEARLSSLGQMAGSIAHEINNPLAIIQSYAELLALASTKNKLDDTKVQTSTQKILETVERIAKIVRGLRTISSDGKREEVKRHNLEKVVEETLVVCKQRFKNNNISLEYNISPTIEVLCNSIQLSQVLINLLNNSFHALTDLKTKWIKIEAKINHKFVDLIVIDSGTGIDSTIRNKIFDPFFTTKTVNLGSGLGLSISKELMKAQNGDLLYDQNTKNTKFIIRIPVI